MNNILKHIEKTVYNTCDFKISKFILEPESIKYYACNFNINDRKVYYRNANITPKKSGQFVTFWQRNNNGTIEPFSETDAIDFFIVTVKQENNLGQFVFPKSILIAKGILTTHKKDGKRAFRVYPPWDAVTNKTAKNTQKWQLKYFVQINASLDIKSFKKLYGL